MTIKGHLQVSMSNVEAVFGRKFLSFVDNGPEMAVLGVKGSLGFKFCGIKKAHPCSKRVF